MFNPQFIPFKNNQLIFNLQVLDWELDLQKFSNRMIAT